MEHITIESDAFKEIIRKIDEIGRKVNEGKVLTDGKEEEEWLDGQEVCMLLKICKRTLQYYRNKRKLPHAKIGSKIYYKRADLEKYLKKHYKKALKNNA
jgi:excisionase family DNA binding protein